MTVRTAYGVSTLYNLDIKKEMLSRVSNAMSIRNVNQEDFNKELNLLLKKYKL